MQGASQGHRVLQEGVQDVSGVTMHDNTQARS